MAILLAGSNAPLPVEHAFMPPFAHGHSDDELAAVANVSHVRQAGNLNLKSALRRLRGTPTECEQALPKTPRAPLAPLKRSRGGAFLWGKFANGLSTVLE